MQIEQDENIQNNNENKSKKTITIIVILIAVTLLIVIGIIFAMMSLKSDKLSVTVDDKRVNFSDDVFVITEDRKSIYFNQRCSTFSWI